MGFLRSKGSGSELYEALKKPRLHLLTGVSLLDVDECAATDPCLGGRCVNTEGSFNCLCETGFQPSPDSGECVGKDSKDWMGLCLTSAHLCPSVVLSSLEQGT